MPGMVSRVIQVPLPEGTETRRTALLVDVHPVSSTSDMRPKVGSGRREDGAWMYLLRKEVIQPHLPVATLATT